MKIYLPNGEELLEVPVKSTAEHEQELMKSDFIRLEWSQDKKTILPCGSYIVYEKDNVKYRLFENYEPDEKDLGEFDYSPEFQHPIMWLGNVPFIHIDGDITSFETADKETEWKYTGMAANLVQEKFVPYLNKVGETITDIGTGWSAIVSADITATADCSFSSMDFLSALNHAASQYECEWHLDYENRILYFGTVSIKTTDLTFEVGVNVNNASITQNKDGYYNAFLAKGSTRNISQVNDKGENIQLNKRLTLDPVKYPKGYIDVRENAEEPLLIKELIFEDIYPSMNLYVYNPRARTRNLLDKDGNTISDGNGGLKRYSVWYVRLAYKLNGEWKDFEIDEENLLGNLSCQFQPNPTSTKYTSSLAGRTFELEYHKENISYPADEAKGDTGVEILAGDYEIIFDQINDLIIPTTIEGGLYPKGDVTPSEDGNILRLYNIAMPSEVMAQAQEELETATLKEIDYYRSDRNNYSFNSNPVEFKKEMPELFLGREVNYINGDYSYTTRIIKLVQKLDFDFEVEITVGNETIKGNTTTMREQLQILMSAYNTGSGSSMSVEDFRKMLNIYGGSMFLSKLNPDTAADLITFLKGLVADGLITAKQGVEFGEFISGYIGKGGRIDALGHGELESLTLRSFLAVPMLRYNRISVTDGESWNTNGFGVIEEVDTENKTITLHLEDDEYASVEQGDICRGIFQDLDSEYSTADADADDCGFATKKGFFTSYFTVVRLISSGKGECRFEYALRNESTPQPCRMMKFAQYGSFTNEQRMSSCYSSAIVHFYSQVMEHVNTWEISPMMVSLRFGWLEGFPVTLKNGNVVRLKDHGLYVPGNVYFGQTITQLDAATIADLKNQLEQYTIEVATAVDVITVDDAGNVIGGLYSLDAEGKKTDYRLSSAVFVKRGNEYLTEADKGADASSGTYRIYAYCDGCECVIDNSTIYITSIKNIKDGIAGTEDDFTFDYDAMRKMTGLTVTVVADCEGIGSISKDYHVTVKHDPKPFINFVMDNQIANISYNTKTQKYVGSPYNIRVSAYKDNAKLPIVAMNGDTEVRIMNVKLSSHEGLGGWGVGYSWDEENNDVVLDVIVSSSNAASAKIMFTCSYNYAGVSYEQNIVHSVNIASDTNTYELMPSVSQVVAKTNQSGELVADTDKITCKVICNSSDDGQYVMTADELTTRKMSVKYSVGDDATLSEFPADGLSVSAEWSKIVFHLFFGDVEIDTQDVPVMLNGVDGSGVEYVFLLTTEDKEPTIYDDSDTEAFQAPDYCPYTDEAHTRQWTDEPTGVGINNRYEWVAQRKRQYGKWLKFSKATKWATHSIDGTSPYSLDLTNESSQVLCDQSGNVIGGYETTAIQLFHGASVMSVSDFNITITATNISYTLSGAVITPSAFASGKDSAQIAVKAELKTNTSVVLTAVYSITKNKAGKDGVIYSLQPSVSTFSKNSNGVWVTKSFYLYAKKTTGAGATEITTLAALEAEGLTLKYGSTTVTSSTLELVPSVICGDNAYADLYLYKGSVVIDRERINVVSDGEKGEDGEGVEYIYKLTTVNEQPEVPATPDPIDTDVKGEWTDNPQGVSAEYPYEWVAEHTKSNGTWGKYKPASIWAKWSKDGSDGKNGKYSKVFYRWSMSKPDAPTLPVTVSRTPPAPWSETFERESLVFLKSSKDAWADEGAYRYSPEGLGDSVSTIDQIEFATTNDNQVVFIELHVSSELNCDFACISGLDDEDFSKDSTKNTVKISGENMVMTEVIVPKAGVHFIRVGYFKDGSLAKGLDRCWYRIINNDNNIICWACTAMLDGETDNILSWSEVVKFVYDTNKQESIYLLSDSLTAPATPKTDKYADDYIPSVTDVKWSETVTYNVNDMVLYNGRVYICKLTSKGNYPTNTEYWKQIHNWTDDPSSVTDEFPYEYISIRKKTDGVWGSYSKPVIWTKWAMDAEAVKGDPGYSLNPPVFYEAGKKYVFERLAGTDIVVRDVVIYPVGGEYYYYMVKNRTDNSEEKVTSVPGETGNNDWQQGSKYELLIADALLAANANIGGFRIYDKKLVSVDDDKNPTEENANLVLDGVKGIIKAKKAEIEGKIIATEGSFDNCAINETCEVGGNLKGVTGTFKRLTALDESGNGATSLVFEKGGLVLDGHIRQNGVTPEGYGLRFYSADIWCRGSFGACQLNTVLVEGDIAYYYYNGFENSNRYEHSLDSFSRNGHTCYDLPLFSPGKENDATGFPVDMVLFRNSDSARYYMFTEAFAGKMVHCINIADKYNNTFILGNSGYTQCLGGVAQTWFYAGGKNINPENTKDGGGWLIMAQYDNNW